MAIGKTTGSESKEECVSENYLFPVEPLDDTSRHITTLDHRDTTSVDALQLGASEWPCHPGKSGAKHTVRENGN